MGRKGARKKVGRKKAVRKKRAGNARNAAAGNAGNVTQKTPRRKKSTQGKQRQRPKRRARRDQEVKRHVALVRQAIEQLDQTGDSPFGEIRHPKKRAFLCAYSLLGSKLRASEAAGINKSLIYTRDWLHDQEFQDALEVAHRMALDVLEDEATRRAVEGWEEPVGWYKGEPGGYVRRYSDTLLIFRLKGELPQKYADRVQLSGGLATLNMDALPDDLLERIARGEHPMAVLASALERGLSLKQLGLAPGDAE